MELKTKIRRKQTFDIKKPVSLIVCICIVLCFAVSGINPPGSYAQENDTQAPYGGSARFSGDNSVADPSTGSTFLNILGDVAEGGKYTGRVWIDKSVYNHSLSGVDGFNNISVPLNPENGEDFLIEYSVLGSSRIINTSASVPLDVVILLDISTSMNNEPGGGTMSAPIRGVLSKSNDLMEQIFDLNDQNRVGVVVYGGGSKAILPLDHYTKSGNTDFLTMDQTKHPANDPGYANRYFNKIIGTGINSRGARVQNSNPYFFADSTYLQGALYDGMEMLASADPTFKTPSGTTALNPDGTPNTRVPTLIVLSDGGTNAFTVDNQNNSWWLPIHNNVIAAASTNPNNNGYYYPPRNGNPLYSPFNSDNETVMSARTVSVLMTAALMKAEVESAYGRDLNGFSILFRGNALNNAIEREQVLTTLDPATYFNSKSSNAATRKAYQYWQTYVNSGSVNIPYNGRYLNGNFSGTQMIRKIPATNSLSAFNSQVRQLDSVNYINKMYDAADSDALGNIFEQIMISISGVAFHPVSSSNGTAEAGVTFTDPLGRYMDVKSIKGVMLFGNFYAGASSSVSGNTTTYTLRRTNIHHPSYVNDTYIDLSAIQIIEEKDPASNTSVLSIKLPEEALPVRCDTIDLSSELDANGNYKVLSYSSNRLNPYEAYPIRIFAAVGAQNDVLSDPADPSSKINLAKIDPAYIAANTLNNGSVAFYANLFTGRTGDTLTQVGGGTAFENETIGDMTVDFFPTEENRYYYFQDNNVIYTKCTNPSGAPLTPNAEGAGAESAKTAGTKGAAVNTPLTNLNDLNDNAIYYFTVNFYAPVVDANGNQIGNEGRYVEWVVPRTGKMIRDSLTLIDNPGYNITGSHAPKVVATATGYNGVRQSELNRFASLKIDNPTETAATNFIPWIGPAADSREYRYVAVEGNNGRLTLKTAPLIVTKAVMLPDGKFAGSGASDLEAPDKTFDINISFDGLSGGAVAYEILTYDPETGAYAKDQAQTPGQIALDASGSGTFSLKANQGIMFANLNQDQKYTVVEQDPGDDFTIISRPASGRVTSDVATMPQVNFINQYNASVNLTDIQIEKSMSDREIQNGDTFSFVIRSADSTPTAPLPQGDNISDVLIDQTTDSRSVLVKYTHSGNNASSVVIPIGSMEFSAPGMYRYVVWELAPDYTQSIPGVSYDQTIYRYSVEVGADPADRTQLAVNNTAVEKIIYDSATHQTGYEPIDPPKLAFENIYDPSEISVSLNAQKIMQGAFLEDGAFSFELEGVGSYDLSSEDRDFLNAMPTNVEAMEYFGKKAFDDVLVPMPAGTAAGSNTVIENDENGNVLFKNIIFTDGDISADNKFGKLYKYTLRELDPGDPNMTYDDDVRTVYLYLYRDGAIAVSQFGDSLTVGGKPFINTINYAAGALQLGVTKNLEGREFTDTDAFTFMLTGSDNAPMPEGYDQDTNSITLNVTGSGGNTAAAAFPSIPYDISDLTPDAAQGVYSAEFVYTIREVIGNIPSVVYDDSLYRITVKAEADKTDNSIAVRIISIDKVVNGVTSPVAGPADGWNNQSQTDACEFTNALTADFASVELNGTKSLTGRNMTPGEFMFCIQECDGNGIPLPNIAPIYTQNTSGAENGGKYESEFAILNPTYFTYSSEGTHHYLLTETNGGDPTVTYDPTQYLIQVTAEKDSAGALKAEAAVAWSKQPEDENWTLLADISSITFNNTAQAIPASFAPTVEKSLTGDFPGDELFIYRFIISADPSNPAGAVMPERDTARVINAGSAYFDAITFDGQSVGNTYKFSIREIPTDYGNIDYDTSVWTLTVPVSEKDGNPYIDEAQISYKLEGANDESAQFNNSWKPIVPPGASKPWVIDLNAQKEVLSYDNMIFDLAANPFTFELIPFETNPEADPIESAIITQNTADGVITLLAGAEYTLPGTYNYLVQETSNNTHSGIIFDDTVYIITVEIERLPSGILNGSISITDGLGNPLEPHEMDFINRYHPGETSVIIDGAKRLNGGLMQGGEFEFELVPVNATVDDGASSAAEPAPDESGLNAQDADDNTLSEEPQNSETDDNGDKNGEEVPKANAPANSDKVGSANNGNAAQSDSADNSGKAPDERESADNSEQSTDETELEENFEQGSGATEPEDNSEQAHEETEPDDNSEQMLDEAEPNDNSAQLPDEAEPNDNSGQTPDEQKPAYNSEQLPEETEPNDNSAQLPEETEPDDNSEQMPDESEPEDNSGQTPDNEQIQSAESNEDAAEETADETGAGAESDIIAQSLRLMSYKVVIIKSLNGDEPAAGEQSVAESENDSLQPVEQNPQGQPETRAAVSAGNEQPETQAAELPYETQPEVPADGAPESPQADTEGESAAIARAALSPEQMPMPAQNKVYNTGAGTFRFGTVVFLMPGTYNYQIIETPAAAEGYTTDPTVYNMTVEVTADDLGFFSSNVTITDETGAPAQFIEFENENSYHPLVEIVKDQTLNDGEFTQDILHAAGGDIITYRLTVSNNSQRDAIDVIVKDPVPAGLTVAENTISGGGYFEDGNVIWRLGILKAGETKQLTFDAVIPEVSGYAEWTNAASVNYKNNPNNPPGGREDIPSNEVKVDTNIPSFDIIKEQSADSQPFTRDPITVIGSEIVYRITVTNTSQAALQDAVVTDKIPDGLTVAPESLNGEVVENGIITWHTGPLAAGETVQFIFTARIEQKVDGAQYLNSAQVTVGGETTPSNTVEANVTIPQTPEPAPSDTPQESPSVTPDQPSAPVQPTVPVQPTAPVQPTVPIQPTAPVQPTVSAQPTAPVQPTVPVQPTAPVQPTVPVQPSAPTSTIGASPKTGDFTQILPYFIILGAGAAAIAGTLWWRKRHM